MSENTTQTLLGNEQAVTELSLLKDRARLMGITFSNNIGLEALKMKVHNKQENIPDEEPEEENVAVKQYFSEQLNAISPMKQPASLREMLLEENMRLVRIRITNMDPKKKDLPGEIFTVANEHIGTVRKYIPYGEASEGGYHVPYILYKRLLNRKFLHIRTFKRAGQIHTETSWVREFSIELLDPLTPKEIQQLATTQAAAGNIG